MDQEFFVREREAHSRLLYHMAYTILRNEAACEDAIQDAVLKAWEKRFTLRETSYFPYPDDTHPHQYVLRHAA